MTVTTVSADGRYQYHVPFCASCLALGLPSKTYKMRHGIVLISLCKTHTNFVPKACNPGSNSPSTTPTSPSTVPSTFNPASISQLSPLLTAPFSQLQDRPQLPRHLRPPRHWFVRQHRHPPQPIPRTRSIALHNISDPQSPKHLILNQVKGHLLTSTIQQWHHRSRLRRRRRHLRPLLLWRHSPCTKGHSAKVPHHR